MKAIKIGRFVNSRNMVAVTGILMLIAARVAFSAHEITYLRVDRGLLFPSPNVWLDGAWLTMVINTGLILATALVWITVLHVFNPFRALTYLPASFFLVMILSVPDLTDQLTTGSVLAAIMPGCFALLWSAFSNESRLRHIFLLFTILSALTMTQYCFAIYIPAFIIGCVQMKIMTPRTIIACVLGIVTPWWIVLGMGLAGFDQMHLPNMTGVLNALDTDGVVNLLMVCIITAILTLVVWFANVMKVISLNVSRRAYNGSIAMVGLFTIIALCADYTNTTAYVPTLMLVASYQLSVLLGSSNDNRNSIISLAVMAVYITFYIVRIFL